jgi:hypothetical protein
VFQTIIGQESSRIIQRNANHYATRGRDSQLSSTHDDIKSFFFIYRLSTVIEAVSEKVCFNCTKQCNVKQTVMLSHTPSQWYLSLQLATKLPNLHHNTRKINL